MHTFVVFQGNKHRRSTDLALNYNLCYNSPRIMCFSLTRLCLEGSFSMTERLCKPPIAKDLKILYYQMSQRLHITNLVLIGIYSCSPFALYRPGTHECIQKCTNLHMHTGNIHISDGPVPDQRLGPGPGRPMQDVCYFLCTRIVFCNFCIIYACGPGL